MSDSTALPEWLAATEAPKNKHARSTVAILATVRLIGLILFTGFFALSGLGTLYSTFTSDQHVLAFILGTMSTAMVAVLAALWYAGISWLTETLNMLTQIARNTAS
jgi:hypothetical protein